MFKKLNLKNLDKKMLIYIGIGVGMIFLLIIILAILKATVSHRIDSKKFESNVKDAAVKYYKENPDKLPKNNDLNITIGIDELVSAGYLKDPDKLLNKGLTCSGNVSVSNNNGFYIYQPIIECSDNYKTKLLYQKILEDNPIKQSGNGLYQINDYYLFRGEELNNRASFAGKKWYILRINNDNTIRMIMINDFNEPVVWDDRYNSSTNNNSGKNEFMISRIKESLDFYYDNMFDEKTKPLIVPKELCIGKRNSKATDMNGSIECSQTTEKLPLGLLQANEFPIVSLDPECKSIYNLQCTNYNYLTSLTSFWTITAASDNTYSTFMISRSPIIRNANEISQARLVLNISANALYNGGSGTSEDPYIIE